jgi:hypothetical protein
MDYRSLMRMDYSYHSFVRTSFSILHNIFAILLVADAYIITMHLHIFFICFLGNLNNTYYIFDYPFTIISFIHTYDFFDWKNRQKNSFHFLYSYILRIHFHFYLCSNSYIMYAFDPIADYRSIDRFHKKMNFWLIDQS